MSRIAPKLASIATLCLVIACNDLQQPVGLTPTKGTAKTITPSGTLDQNIFDLFALFPKGLQTAGLNQWKTIKVKYAEGQTDAQKLNVAKQQLIEIVKWVKNKTDQMNTPPDAETREAAASRLILYMSQYVYNGPTFIPPAYTPSADVAVEVVEPSQGDTIVTPAAVAGIGLEAGSVAEPTVIVVTQNPNPYPANCSGPLQTKLCQYPRFYKFDQFPHVKLLKQAKIAVCHINNGTERAPLADHDRFRLAHTLPANPADYTPGSTIRNTGGEAIEILPLVTQTFVNCGDVEYASNTRGPLGALTRLARGIKKFVMPTTAYAIDQGLGGGTFEFSDFNDVDPLGAADNNVDSATFTPGPYHEGDNVTVSYTVNNQGTATGTSVPVRVRLSNDSTFDPGDLTLATSALPDLNPGDTVNLAISFVIPTGIATGSWFLGLEVGSDPVLPDPDLGNNKRGGWASFQIPFVALANRMDVGDASACALNSSGATYCWGMNNWRQLATISPDTAAHPTPVATPTPTFASLSTGRGYHFCGITAAGAATCWGRNSLGELGIGTLSATSGPSAVAGGILWREITTGRITSCGVSTSNLGYCWGANQRGEVGSTLVSINTNSLTPHLLDGSLQWKTVVAGWLHACGITTSGVTYCWGENRAGQLGIGAADTTSHRTPTPVASPVQFIQLSLGTRSTCGISVDHRAYCWGENPLGQVGDGTISTAVATPSLVSGSVHFSYVSVSSGFGDGASTGVVPQNPLPGQPGLGGQGGYGFTCALTEQGNARCWGWNANGTLGNGSTVNSSSEVAVGGGNNFTRLSTGGSSTCGVWLNSLRCWGANARGQLGNGTMVNASFPTLAASPFDVP